MNGGGDSCSIQWRISQVSCWTDWIFYPDMQKMEKEKNPKTLADPVPNHRGYTVYEPCNDVCCARRIKVCRIFADSVTIDDMGILSGENNCDTITYKSLDCYFTCNFLENIHYSILPESENDEILEVKETISDGILEVSYNNSKFKVEFNNYKSDNIALSIINLLGKIALTKFEKLEIGNNIYEVDISKLQSGVYLFNISIDGLSVKTGKLNLIR